MRNVYKPSTANVIAAVSEINAPLSSFLSYGSPRLRR